jgi:hypothetical protein
MTMTEKKTMTTEKIIRTEKVMFAKVVSRYCSWFCPSSLMSFLENVLPFCVLRGADLPSDPLLSFLLFLLLLLHFLLLLFLLLLVSPLVLWQNRLSTVTDGEENEE